MNFKEYYEKAQSTAIYPNRGKNLAYTVLGLVEETAEAMDKEKDAAPKEFIKEVGDILWYLTMTASEAKIDMVKLTPESNHERLMDLVANIAGIAKKVMRDEDGLISVEKKDKLLQNLRKIVYIVDTKLQNKDSSIEEAMKINIEKLSSRKERGVIKGSGDNR